MGTPARPAEDEVRRRMAAWAAEWQAVAGSTEPADRPRAEAALRALYAAAGMAEPVILWVPSPAAGTLAYVFASMTHGKVRSLWARGDIGNGANRDFNGLASPFGLEPAWVRRIATSIGDRVPSALRQGNAVSDPLRAAAASLGMGGTDRAMALVRSITNSSRESFDVGDAVTRVSATDEATLAVAATALGAAWPPIVKAMGRDMAGSLFAAAVAQVAKDMLRSHGRRRDAVQAMQPGQWDTLTPVLASVRDVFGGCLWRPIEGRAEHEAQIDSRLELARSAGPWWALHGLAIVSERPIILRRDDRGRPHATNGPAIAWADGLEAYAVRGVVVEPWVVTEPGRITVELIDREANIEVRRVLIECFGEEQLLVMGGAQLVHQDETGRLWRRDFKRASLWVQRDEPIVMVEVENSTPEPDGSRKTYFLRVPPTTRTAHEAVAWTFGLGAVEYRPAVES